MNIKFTRGCTLISESDTGNKTLTFLAGDILVGITGFTVYDTCTDILLPDGIIKSVPSDLFNVTEEEPPRLDDTLFRLRNDLTPLSSGVPQSEFNHLFGNGPGSGISVSG